MKSSQNVWSSYEHDEKFCVVNFSTIERTVWSIEYSLKNNIAIKPNDEVTKMG